MDLGIKLDIDFLEKESTRRLFGTDDPLPTLRKHGVRIVEAAVDPDTDFATLTGHARMCCDAGFQVSLHPYTERTACNSAYFSRSDEKCRRFHARVFTAAEEAARRSGCNVTVNIHGAAGEKAQARADLVAETTRFFVWARQWCLENAPMAQPVIELQFRPHLHETIQRIGDEYKELVEIANRAEVCVCWDFGHAYMNGRRFGLPVDPPEEFLQRIAHIHCHDVNDIDHYPLVYDRVPWASMLALALDHGFDGTVVLEVPPENFMKAGGLPSLIRSIEGLKAVAARKLPT